MSFHTHMYNFISGQCFDVYCMRIKWHKFPTEANKVLHASGHRTVRRNFPILKDTPLWRFHQTAYLCFCFSLSSLNLSSFILSVELRRSFSFWARFIFRSCSFLCLISLISATFRIRSSRFLYITNTAVLSLSAECRNPGILSVKMMCWNTGVLAMTIECRNTGVLSLTTECKTAKKMARKNKGILLLKMQMKIGAPEKTQSVCVHALGPQTHLLDFHPVCENYAPKSTIRTENTP